MNRFYSLFDVSTHASKRKYITVVWLPDFIVIALQPLWYLSVCMYMHYDAFSRSRAKWMRWNIVFSCPLLLIVSLYIDILFSYDTKLLSKNGNSLFWSYTLKYQGLSVPDCNNGCFKAWYNVPCRITCLFIAICQSAPYLQRTKN